MKKDSSQLLSRSITNRFNQVMVGILSNFDDKICDPNGDSFKYSVKSKMNDAIRATMSELNDYTIEYRPLRINNDGSMRITPEFMAAVQDINFTNSPSMKIYTENNNFKILSSVRDELGAGLIYQEDRLIFEIVGITDCVNCVLPFMDKYATRLQATVRQNYNEWRKLIVKEYINGI